MTIDWHGSTASCQVQAPGFPCCSRWQLLHDSVKLLQIQLDPTPDPIWTCLVQLVPWRCQPSIALAHSAWLQTNHATKQSAPLPMFFELLFPHGDAHIWNSIMAALQAGSVCGSHPFAALFLNHQEFPVPSLAMPLLSDSWNLQAFCGTKADCAKRAKEGSKILG